MIDTNNGSQIIPIHGAKTKKLRELFNEHGPDLLFEKAYALAAEEGMDVSRALFREVHGEFRHKEVILPARPTPTPLRAATPTSDGLAMLIKFACAVEAVGGPEPARQLLDHLEVVRHILAPREPNYATDPTPA